VLFGKRYLREYTDKKEIGEIVMKKYLKELSPFEPYPEPAKYKMLSKKKGIQPRWMRFEIDSERLRKHEFSMIPYAYADPTQSKVEEFIQNLPYQQKQKE
jgi:hypothetical protein